ncbi:MAG: SOS response-associated peptidase [Paracoccus sp. (in: a-proteobacteria)]|uniref:SOS response-associated peptidase n=1 Tax=Paracoccus sp. TaxID=267 RepID=UPI0039198C57
MCNLYSNTTTQEAMRRIVEGLSDRAGNLTPGSIYPDQLAPIVRNGSDGPELVKARWGMPSPPSVLKTARDPGVTNVRNLSSPHWRRWLGREHRCLVPLTSFAELRGKGQGNQWFAAADDRPMFFAGIEVRDWASIRKVKDGETTDDLFAFLTCPPNAEVSPIHPKAMPVILMEPDGWRGWLGGIPAQEMQRALPDGALQLMDMPV